MPNAFAVAVRRAVRLFVLAPLLAGCVTHLWMRTREHLTIHWQPSFDAARAEAERAHKPILVLLVAGKIDGAC
jgi:hypothetical protein